MTLRFRRAHLIGTACGGPGHILRRLRDIASRTLRLSG